MIRICRSSFRTDPTVLVWSQFVADQTNKRKIIGTARPSRDNTRPSCALTVAILPLLTRPHRARRDAAPILRGWS